jgi:adenosylcobinamide-GDP ribazoletransferase
MKTMLRACWQNMLGAIAFYTVLPVPQLMAPSFQYVSRLAPVVGGLIGSLLGLLDTSLHALGMPLFTTSTILVVVWVMLTGGLHLDGAMDAADGLAVMDPHRRLDVMADSRTGAFGVMMALGIIALKISALTDLSQGRGWALVLAATWGRWGQQMAIACYPYLKAKGKGAFHKQALPTPWLCLPSLAAILGIHLLWIITQPIAAAPIGLVFLWGGAIALTTGYWFHQKFGGHTGDTYGAVVELTETIVLLGMVGLTRYLENSIP